MDMHMRSEARLASPAWGFTLPTATLHPPACVVCVFQPRAPLRIAQLTFPPIGRPAGHTQIRRGLIA